MLENRRHSRRRHNDSGASLFIMAAGMMSAVLYFSNSRLSRYTGFVVSLLVTVYITAEAPISGMSINPGRSFGSALASGIWNDFWIYLTAPLLGMLTAAQDLACLLEGNVS